MNYTTPYLNVGSTQFKHIYRILLIVFSVLISTVSSDLFYYKHDTVKWLLFDVFSALSLCIFLNMKKPIVFSKTTMLAMTLALIMCLSILWAPNKFASIEYILRFLGFLISIYVLREIFTKEELLKLVLNIVFLSALDFSLVFFAERYILETPYNKGNFSPFGFTNNAGQVFNIWIPLLVINTYVLRKHKLKCALSLITLLSVVVILMEAGTRGTILGLTIGELVVFFIMLKQDKKKAIWFLSISLLLVISIATYHLVEPLRKARVVAQMNYLSMGTTKREALFRNTFEMALENPKGVGVNNFEYLHPKYANLDTRPSPYVSDSTILRTPHNISLKMFSEVGYIGGIVFILIVLSILWSGLKSAYFGTYTEKWLFVALFALLFHAHFSAVFLTPGSLFFAVLLFSLILIRNNNSVRKTPQAETETLAIKVGDFPVLMKIVLLCLFTLIPCLNIASKYYAAIGARSFSKAPLEVAIKINPYNERALYDLAQVEMRRYKNPSAAESHLKHFLQINPNHIGGLINLARVHFQLHNYNAAQARVDYLLNFYPNYEPAKRLQRIVQRRMKFQKNNKD